MAYNNPAPSFDPVVWKDKRHWPDHRRELREAQCAASMGRKDNIVDGDSPYGLPTSFMEQPRPVEVRMEHRYMSSNR